MESETQKTIRLTEAVFYAMEWGGLAGADHPAVAELREWIQTLKNGEVHN